LIYYSHFYEIPAPYKYSLLLGAGSIMLVGFLDDIYGLSNVLRLISQFLFMFLIAYFFDVHIWIANSLNLFNIFIAFVFLIGSIWLINTFNFIDGADGLLSTNIAIFSLISGFYFFLSGENTLAVCLWILCSINLGFLIFNWSPAKVFMGDSGSLLLGSIFVIFIIGSSITTQIPIWAWMSLLAIFYVETTVTRIILLLRGENIFKVHHSLHAYQRQVITSGNHSRPAKISIWINVLWTIPLSISCYLYPEYGALITLLTCIPLSIIFYIYGPYQTTKR
jgi:Fuc2NAc and GlcNAc transferase